MRERREGGDHGKFAFEIDALREVATTQGGLKVPGRPESQLWNIARIDESRGLVFLIRAEGGIIERREGEDIGELYRLNTSSTVIDENINRGGVVSPLLGQEVVRTGTVVAGVLDVKAAERAQGQYFDKAESLQQIIQLIQQYPEQDAKILSALRIVTEIQEEFEAGDYIDAIKIKQLTRTGGLREAVLQLIRPNFIIGEDLYKIREKLVRATVQHNRFETDGVEFLKSSSGAPFSSQELSRMLQVLADFIDLFERDVHAEVYDNDPAFASLTSSYGLRDATQAAVRALTAKTDRAEA